MCHCNITDRPCGLRQCSTSKRMDMVLYCILRIYIYKYTHICGNIVNNNDDFNKRTNTLLYKNINLSHFIFERVMFSRVWEMSGDRDGLLYWPKFFSWPWQHFFCILAGVAGFHFGIPVSTELDPPGHLLILFPNIHLLPLFFRLFTPVHRLIDGSVEG